MVGQQHAQLRAQLSVYSLLLGHHGHQVGDAVV
jgi:hypothetical protein